MFYLILSGLVILALVVSFTALKIRHDKYVGFILDNSVALKKLLEINIKYNFYSCRNYDAQNTYDNNIFFDNISCQDYLIYQLQFEKNNVVRDIRNVNENQKNYELYCNEVDLINCSDEFTTSTEKLNIKYLLSLQQKLFNKTKLKPQLIFSIFIKLYCSKINGEIYDSKQHRFYSNEIINLINKLNNKRGDFYNDREIWDAICRVERGKVSNRMRFSIYKRDGYRCRICGRSGAFNDLEIDHIRPIAKGGKTTYDNLQTLCRRCNKRKGDSW